MAELATIRYGDSLLTRTTVTTNMLADLLKRFPASLWDTDPSAPTLQRELLRILAEQMAAWLEQRTIARQMHLLLEAQGVDLDRLLEDYGLRRYLQRPDAYARQVGMHALWMPKGTTRAIRRMADLLFDLPHVTLNTGRNEVHVFIADTHPITTPYTYWGMVSQDGRWYAVTIDHGLPILATFPVPGMNLAPGPPQLTWFMVRDETQAPWYVVIEGDTLALTATAPLWGQGTTTPFRVLDGAQGLWELRVDRKSSTLAAVPVTGSTPYAYWRCVSSDTATLYYVYVAAQVLVISTIAPPGRDETPLAATPTWLTLYDATAVPWYLFIAGGTVELTRVQPAGTGTTDVFRVLDGAGTAWEVGVDRPSATVELRLLTPASTQYTLLNPGYPFETVQLLDEANTVWWLSIPHRVPELSTTPPVGATDVTPAGGPYRWLRLLDRAGTRWYAYPSAAGLWHVATTSPGGAGTNAVQMLGDRAGVRWYWGVDPAGAFAISDTPRRTLDGLSTALALRDQDGVTWFWRVTGASPFFDVSNVLWPDSITQMPWGEIGWLRMANLLGAPRYVFPERYTGTPTVSNGPPADLPWGWTEPLVLIHASGQPYALTIDASDTLVYTSQPPDDIPAPAPLLSLREVRDAMQHVQSAGSLVTVYLS